MDVPCRPVTSGGTVFCSLILYPSSAFPWGSLWTMEEGSKYDAFPSTPLGAASALLNTTCRPLFSRLRVVGLSLVLQCTSGRPFVRLRGRPHGVFRLPPGVRFPPFLELTSLISSIILEKGVCHYTSRPAVVLDSIVRQGPGHLVLDGYHCLILSEALPSSWWGRGETWLNNKFVHDTRWEAKRHTPPVREILFPYRY